MATTFVTLNFRHVIDLLHYIEVAPTASWQSRWWVDIVIGILHGGFRGSWVQSPSSDWLRTTLGFFSRHATTLESVERQFAIQHPNARKISLRDPETWKNELTSPSQPPSSKPDGRSGADSKLARMKEKTPETPNLTGRITRLDSAPMARGGYSSVWRGTLLSATPDDPDRATEVALKVLHASSTDESTVKRKLLKKCEYGPNCVTRTWYNY
ncbi:hypothetical protein BS47DRAFT_734681 [Hydnum rufescens UP504]|uniref:Uncharacterized protein n=1 Tax=Hydnum rufescens UP504 TaxID=1448309 RepID=A0A9P6ADZ4_9AGAM|nr:hypothetical protein BS47DRAFT_734681 [Hydnum rufescens UP504]